MYKVANWTLITGFILCTVPLGVYSLMNDSLPESFAVFGMLTLPAGLVIVIISIMLRKHKTNALLSVADKTTVFQSNSMTQVSSLRKVFFTLAAFAVTFSISAVFSNVEPNFKTCNEAGAFHTVFLGIPSCFWSLLFTVSYVVLGLMLFWYTTKSIVEHAK